MVRVGSKADIRAAGRKRTSGFAPVTGPSEGPLWVESGRWRAARSRGGRGRNPLDAVPHQEIVAPVLGGRIHLRLPQSDPEGAGVVDHPARTGGLLEVPEAQPP